MHGRSAKKIFWENVLSGSISFSHRHKDFEIALSDEGTLELYLDGCLRKKGSVGPRSLNMSGRMSS